MTALAVCIIAALLVLGTSASGPTSAFAAWSATPTKPAHGEISAAEARCHQSTPPALVDTRGPFEHLLFDQPGRQVLLCTAWPNGATARDARQPRGKSAAPNTVTTITCVSGGLQHAIPPPAQAYLQMYGLTGKNVTQVTLRLQGGATVRATTSNGLWAAWWPGSHRDLSIEFKTATASTTVRHTNSSSEFSTNC